MDDSLLGIAISAHYVVFSHYTIKAIVITAAIIYTNPTIIAIMLAGNSFSFLSRKLLRPWPFSSISGGCDIITIIDDTANGTMIDAGDKAYCSLVDVYIVA